MWPYCPCFENVLCGCIVWWNYCVVVATLALSTPAAQRDRARGSGLGSSYGTLIINSAFRTLVALATDGESMDYVECEYLCQGRDMVKSCYTH